MAKPGEHKIVKCNYCHNDYRQSRSDQLYCSGKCSSSAWRNKRNTEKNKVECVVCGKPFVPKSENNKYCSGDCSNQADKTRKRNGTGKGWSKGMKFVKHTKNCVCDYCGKKFFKRPCYIARNNNHHFCSQYCRVSYIGNNKDMFPSKSPRSNSGKRSDLNNQYFRSSWEANYARYLNWLISLGEIKKWEYEVDTYEFPVKRGSKFYTPDFKIYNNDESIEYHEVKGYMDQRSSTKLRRMTRYYPEIKIVLIDKDQYDGIRKTAKPFLLEWEGR